MPVRALVQALRRHADYPIWSLLIITLDVLVIWALAAHGCALAEV
jgi:hypothetical protein